MTYYARDQAITQMQYIEDLLFAYHLEWDFLEELQDHCEEEDLATLHELTEQAAGCNSQEEVLERIQENPLSIRFRSDWESNPSDLTASEFEILLCTGGPAVRIRGYLDDYGSPSHAFVEYQDWGTQWTVLSRCQSTALKYAQLLLQDLI